MNNRVLVTGTGKCGTTFFMELLTELGFDTGYEPGTDVTEWNVQHSDAVLEGQPHIIKSPSFNKNNRIRDLSDRWDWNVEHVYILLRDFEDVANNRWKRWRHKSSMPVIEDQEYKRNDEQWLTFKRQAAAGVGSLMLQVVSEDIPYTFLMFPRIVTDPQYLYDNLKHTLPDVGPYDRFLEAFNKVADTGKVHWGLEEAT